MIIIKSYFPYLVIFFLLLFTGCIRDKEETIKREIKIREARRGRDMVSLEIHYNKDLTDTFAVYYEAKVKMHDKDSTVNDSLFFIKMDDTLLPFNTSNNK